MRNSIFSDFISLFFPRYCYACKKQLFQKEEHICLSCEHTLPKTNYHLDTQNPVMTKMYGKANIQFASSYLKFVKSGKAQRLLHMLKYQNKPEIGNVLGIWYGLEITEKISEMKADLIIPVPLHKKKLKKRGYNQSDGFAEGLSESLSIASSLDSLVRVKENATQTNKSKIERWDNVDGIFKVNNHERIVDKSILLVDDVITTGSTLAACANEMLNEGAKEVSIVTIAVAEYV